MAAYLRPPLVIVPTLDDAGEPVVHGSRWAAEGPPEWAYSVEAHPERFAPLHAIADALVAHLVATHVVSTRDLDPASVVRQPGPTVGHAVLWSGPRTHEPAPDDAEAAARAANESVARALLTHRTHARWTPWSVRPGLD